mgnify:CR=1 FL=1
MIYDYVCIFIYIATYLEMTVLLLHMAVCSGGATGAPSGRSLQTEAHTRTSKTVCVCTIPTYYACIYTYTYYTAILHIYIYICILCLHIIYILYII